MKKWTILALLLMFLPVAAGAQEGVKKVYDETINQMEQIDLAVKKAKAENKFVICQVGGNWCPWCLRFADFITKDAEISKLVEAERGVLDECALPCQQPVDAVVIDTVLA